jgi:hypothetical protein
MPADQEKLAHRIARALPGLHSRRGSRPTDTVLMSITYA